MTNAGAGNYISGSTFTSTASIRPRSMTAWIDRVNEFQRWAPGLEVQSLVSKSVILLTEGMEIMMSALDDIRAQMSGLRSEVGQVTSRLADLEARISGGLSASEAEGVVAELTEIRSSLDAVSGQTDVPPGVPAPGEPTPAEPAPGGPAPTPGEPASTPAEPATPGQPVNPDVGVDPATDPNHPANRGRR